MSVVSCAAPSPSPSAKVVSSPTETPNFVVDLKFGEQSQRPLRVYDHGGLLAGVSAANASSPPPNPPSGPPNIWLEPIDGDPYRLALNWIGGVCGEPSLQVTAEDSNVSLAVIDGGAALASGEECVAMGFGYAVGLTFKHPVAELKLSVALIEQPMGDQ